MDTLLLNFRSRDQKFNTNVYLKNMPSIVIGNITSKSIVFGEKEKASDAARTC